MSMRFEPAPLPAFVVHPSLERVKAEDVRAGDNCRAKIPMTFSRYAGDWRILCCSVEEVCGPIIRVRAHNRKDLVPIKREDILEVWRARK